jgi:hypothetical protein
MFISDDFISRSVFFLVLCYLHCFDMGYGIVMIASLEFAFLIGEQP